MAASSSSAAADSRPPKYEVFISFRGEARNSFTSHLYSALRQKHINTYIDEESLEKEDDISRELPKAIEESAISIIIFSENYADSRWCLDELVHILKCKEEKNQIPIFYGINPSHVRNQEGAYAAAFVKHQERFKDKMDKVEEWRQALRRAADLSGWDSWGKSESVLVRQVVDVVIRKLENIWSIRFDDQKGLGGILRQLSKIESLGLGGIRRQLSKIESLLCFDSPNVCILGIWGMGGIGKTTLARDVYQCFSNRFEGTCFLRSVREEAQRKGLDALEKEVFYKLLREKDPDVYNPFVNVRLSRTKSLLVLDDVDNYYHLKRLAGDRDRFGPGSKIIVISRDLQVLKPVIDVGYEVQALDLNEASQLFYLKAFEENACRTGYKEISAEVVSYTGGNPLVLQVLGSSLKSLGIKEWESALKKLKRIPHVDIQKVLRISFDGLDIVEQDIFLDIACFFKDKKRDFVEGILEHKSSIVITDLVRKSLINIDQDGFIRMHDLIQEMGWEIVRQSTKKLGERSRLWTAEDVSYVLENNKGTEAIEGIYIPWNYKDVHLRPDVFEEMCNLRLLRMSPFNVYINGDLKYLPNGLRYLHWEGYPGKSLRSIFKPQNLVELHMPNSKLQQLWDGVQALGNLRHIDLHNSQRLTKIPDLSLAPKLESINLSYCRRLIYIPSLNFQATLKDESPYIILSNCVSLTFLPKVSGSIRKLVLSGTALKELPSSIESLENLLHLDLRKCYNLKSLPKLPRNIEVLELDSSGIEQIPSSSLGCLCSLLKLSLSYCKSLWSLPSNINLKALEELNLRQTSIQELPSTIENLIGLRRLYLDGCKHLELIPKTLYKLTRLQELSFSGCSEVGSVPVLWGLCSLTQLNLSDCNIREIPAWLGSLTSLTVLDLQWNAFGWLPASIGMLYKLKKLDISNCRNLQSLPASIGMLHKLKKLDISNCNNLRSLPASIGMLYKLKKLDIRKCKKLQSLPELPLFIESVEADHCSSLEMVSTLRSTHTLGRWLDKYDSDGYHNERRFSFLNCTKLGEDAINKIFTEFVYKVFCTATTPREVVDSAKEIGELVVCYPTKEIPRWFNNQSKGSSITIPLPPNWYNPKTFLGFVVSVVFREEEYYTTSLFDFEFHCELHLKTNCGESLEVDVFEYSSHVHCLSDNMVAWYKYFDHSKANFDKYTDASLEFTSHGIIVKCGVRMLYLKDAVEESGDGTTANFESWITDVIDFDTDYATSDDDDQSCGR